MCIRDRVDAGLEAVKALGLEPDMIVGDFDTVKPEVLAYYRRMEHIVWDTHQPEKDETDTELALLKAQATGCTEVVVLGATGGRMDHMPVSYTHLHVIESVWMQYHHGNSVCISSQVGCRMGCRFCASTLDGLERNLRPSEMLEQIYRIQSITGERVSNVVVMGSGEPMDNYDNVIRFLRLVSHEKGLNISCLLYTSRCV